MNVKLQRCASQSRRLISRALPSPTGPVLSRPARLTSCCRPAPRSLTRVKDSNKQSLPPTSTPEVSPKPPVPVTPAPQSVPAQSPASASTSSNEAPVSSSSPLLAGGAFALAILLFAGGRVINTQPTLGSLERASIPFEVAMSNGKPTVVEFYANWCKVCNELAPDEFELEQKYGSNVNFVMLNVDNNKWAPEMAEYGVNGIPHFIFLDETATAQGAAVGRVPMAVLEGNLAALASREQLPFNRGQGVSGASTQSSLVRQGAMSGPTTRIVNSSPRDHS